MVEGSLTQDQYCNSVELQIQKPSETGVIQRNIEKNKHDSKPQCFLDGNFANIVLPRIFQQQKVPYGDLCQLSKLDRYYGGLARQKLTCASPRYFNNLEKLKERFGQQITSLDLSGSKQEIKIETLEQIPKFFPNAAVVKVAMTPFDFQNEWQQQNSIQILLKSTTQINAKLMMVDCVKICDADGEDFVNEWAVLLKNFLLHLKKYWKSVSMSFRFFRLQSLLMVLRQFEDINEEGVFEIRVTAMLTMEYLFKQLGSQDQVIDEQQFNQVKNFVSSSKILSKVLINISMFHRNLDNPMFEQLLDTLRNAPCTSDTIHFNFSKYVVTWVNSDVDLFTCEKNPTHMLYRKTLFQNKLSVHVDIENLQVKDQQRKVAYKFLEKNKDLWVGGIEMLNIKNYRCFHANQLISSNNVRFIHIEFNNYQLKKFTQQKGGMFNQFPNLLILSLISNDYEADSESLTNFVDQFSGYFQRLQAFYFYQQSKTHVDKTEIIDTSFLKNLPGLVIIDIFASNWNIEIRSLISHIQNLRYLDSISLKIKIASQLLTDEKEQPDMYKKVSDEVAKNVPRLRFVNIDK